MREAMTPDKPAADTAEHHCCPDCFCHPKFVPAPAQEAVSPAGEEVVLHRHEGSWMECVCSTADFRDGDEFATFVRKGEK